MSNSGSDNNMSDIRRERDTIRSEMERIVRQMQQIEADIDNKRPGADQKREQLTSLRNELSDLRHRMRRVMDQAAAFQQSQLQQHFSTSNRACSNGGTTTSSAAAGMAVSPAPYLSDRPISPTRNHQATAPAPMMQSLSSRSGAPSHISHDSPYGQSVAPSYRNYQAATPGMGGSVMRGGGGAAAFSKSADSMLGQLRSRHASEKDAFHQEVTRLMAALEDRQRREEDALLQRCQMEAAQLREIDEARARLERAQVQLESIQAQPTPLDDPRYDGAPELRLLRAAP